jgi:hypothetical protein
MEDVRVRFTLAKLMGRRLFSRENYLALLIAVLILLIIILSADSSPQWIYQGF